jgi:tRNA pseudouridine13 synthase
MTGTDAQPGGGGTPSAGDGLRSGALAPRPVPLLTAELPGTGGLLRVSLEDFRVEELPLYEPSGAGTHVYVEVEKRGRTTQEVARELAAILGAREREVGAAGLKDKRGVTVQRLSVPLAPGVPPTEQVARAAAASGPDWRALSAALHGNKLRPGHLRGNRFRIVVRGCVPGALQRAELVAGALRTRGVANLYGPQRFGKRGDNAALGAAILRREANVRDRFLRRFALSALQSELFNRCLAARIRDGLFDRAIAGDVLRKRETGGLFVCDDPAADSARVASGELDPAGPLPGHSLFAARGEALAREHSVVEEAGVDPRSFAVGGGEMEGARRPYRVVPGDLHLAQTAADALEVAFSLPRGSYAIAVLRELTKAATPDADAPDE